MFQNYVSVGLCVIPLVDGKPAVAWKKYQTELPAEALTWEGKYNECALVCGKISGVIALDIDTNDSALIAKFEALAGISPVKKVGSKGFTAFYKYNGEKTQGWGGVVEILSDKHLTTIPPSKHREKNLFYKWHGDELIGATLPVLSESFIDVMNVLYPKPVSTYSPRIESIEQKVELEDAERMLSFLSSDCGRQEWIEIGMALRDEFGDLACNLWHAWSAKSSKYKLRDAQTAWRSFYSQGITIGTLVYRAKMSGFQFEVKREIFDYTPVKEVPQQNNLHVHGLVGEIADWITETAIVPQPILSLSAALAFVGLVKSNYIQHELFGARTNMMTLSLAPTGAGKDYPQKAIYNLAEACGIDAKFLGRPTSGTALLVALREVGGCGLLSIDEMGRYMGNISGASSKSFQNEICDLFVELFGLSNGTYLGKSFADPVKNPRLIIKNPHLCCLASTVPEKLMAACNSSQLADGFLNRWLVFSSMERPRKVLKRGLFTPPPALVDKIVGWIAAHLLEDEKPLVISYTKEAWNIYLQFEEEMFQKVRATPHPIDDLYVRAPEHVVKLSMIISDEDAIGVHDINSAIKIVRQSNEHILKFALGITDNQYESDVVFILDLVKRNPGISRNALTQKSRKINQKLRTDILNQLVESGEIIPDKEGKAVRFSVA